MITTLPGANFTKPGSAGVPFFGVDVAVVDDQGKEVKAGVQGKLVIRKPWPSMLRSIYGDAERYEKTYWSEVPGTYFTGDGAKKDKDGYFWISGRMDDVLNVSGHRLGTAEVAVGVKFNLIPAGTLGTCGLFAGQTTVDQATADGIAQGLTYFNIHTAANGGGEIRGQIVP